MTAGLSARFDAVLAEAVRAHKEGHIEEARRSYDEALALAPDHGWANYFRGLVAEHDGDSSIAIAHFRRATAASRPPIQAFVALGNAELAASHAQAALDAFTAAITLRPLLAAAFTGKALALKQLDRLEEAATAGVHALRLRRQWRPGDEGRLAELDPSERSEMRRANRVKLLHDAAQLRYLHRQGRLDEPVLRIAAAYEDLARQLSRLPDDTTIVELDQQALQSTDFAYNRLLHLPEVKAPPEGTLHPATDFSAADAAFATARPAPTVVDDVLSLEALNRLQAFCHEATIWFEVKDHGGHLGAYFEEGLACDLLISIARELRAALPRSLGQLRLTQLWAYKHSPTGSGTDLHADIGAVSANLWITPDKAPADNQGGIEIWPLQMPDDWDFRRANIERDGIRRILAQSGLDPIVVPYRCNRLVLFGANLFHRSCPGAFSAEYESRRVNITFLHL